MAEGEEQIQDMQAPEEEQVLQRELELLTDNARYSDEYRAMQKMEHLKSDGENSSTGDIAWTDGKRSIKGIRHRRMK